MPGHLGAVDSDRHPPRGASTEAAGAMLYLTGADAVDWLAAGAEDTVLSMGAASVPEYRTPSEVLDVMGSTEGDLLYRTAAGWSVVGIGSAGEVLTVFAGLPSWQAASGGGWDDTDELLNLNSDADTTDQDVEFRMGSGDGTNEVRVRRVLVGGAGTPVVYEYFEGDNGGLGTFALTDYEQHIGTQEGGDTTSRSTSITLYSGDGSAEYWFKLEASTGKDAVLEWSGTASTETFMIRKSSGVTFFVIDPQNSYTTLYRGVRFRDGGSSLHADFNTQANSITIGDPTENDAIEVYFGDNLSAGFFVREQASDTDYIVAASTDGSETIAVGADAVTSRTEWAADTAGDGYQAFRSTADSDAEHRQKTGEASTAADGALRTPIEIPLADGYAMRGKIYAIAIEQSGTAIDSYERDFVAVAASGSITVAHNASVTVNASFDATVAASDGGSNVVDIDLTADTDQALNWSVWVEYQILRNS